MDYVVIFINIILLSLGTLQYFLLEHISKFNILLELFLHIITYLTKNYLMINMIELGTRDNEWIKGKARTFPKEKFKYEFHIHVIIAALLETMTVFIINKFIVFSEVNYFWDLIMFIPVSFAFEIIFDFFHYWTHRFGHYENRFHKKHHTFTYPSPITTFYQHPVDIVMTNSIPVLFALVLLPFPISKFQISLISMYKTFTEISGHMGKKAYPRSCFPQCPPLVKWLSIELYTEEHDLHHSGYWNFGKRFKLWDKIFGTYKEPKGLMNS